MCGCWGKAAPTVVCALCVGCRWMNYGCQWKVWRRSETSTLASYETSRCCVRSTSLWRWSRTSWTSCTPQRSVYAPGTHSKPARPGCTEPALHSTGPASPHVSSLRITVVMNRWHKAWSLSFGTSVFNLAIYYECSNLYIPIMGLIFH